MLVHHGIASAQTIALFSKVLKKNCFCNQQDVRAPHPFIEMFFKPSVFMMMAIFDNPYGAYCPKKTWETLAIACAKASEKYLAWHQIHAQMQARSLQRSIKYWYI